MDIIQLMTWFESAKKGDIAKLKELLNLGMSVNKPNSTGETALYLACLEDHYDTIEFLLNIPGIKIDLSTSTGNTPLLASCGKYNSDKTIINLLLKHGANINRGNNDNFTPLMKLCKYGRISLIKEFLSRKVEVNEVRTGGYGNTWDALMYACYEELPEIVKLLILHGARLDRIYIWDLPIETGSIFKFCESHRLHEPLQVLKQWIKEDEI